MLLKLHTFIELHITFVKVDNNLPTMQANQSTLQRTAWHSTYLQFKPISKHYNTRQGIELRANTGNRNKHNTWSKNQN